MKKYILILSCIINVVFLGLLIYIIGTVNKNEKEFYCRDVAHEAVFSKIAMSFTLSNDSYHETYDYAYNNCVEYRKNK